MPQLMDKTSLILVPPVRVRPGEPEKMGEGKGTSSSNSTRGTPLHRSTTSLLPYSQSSSLDAAVEVIIAKAITTKKGRAIFWPCRDIREIRIYFLNLLLAAARPNRAGPRRRIDGGTGTAAGAGCSVSLPYMSALAVAFS
jgi:hypothetical protein